MLSTPPAFVLSQDQTLRYKTKSLTTRSQTPTQTVHGGARSTLTQLKPQTVINQKINKIIGITFPNKNNLLETKKHTIEFSNNTPPQDTTTHPQQARRSPPDSHHSEPTTTSTAPLQGPSPRRLIQLYTPPTQHANPHTMNYTTHKAACGCHLQNWG